MWEADLNLDLSNPRKACVYPSTGCRMQRMQAKEAKQSTKKEELIEERGWCAMEGMALAS